jgi:hypothetical protein
MSQLGFDQKEVNLENNFTKDSIPDGKYDCMIASAKDVQFDKGEAVVFNFVIGSGEHQGKTYEGFFAVHSVNDMQQEIARRMVVELGVACGIAQGDFQDTDQVLNKRITINLKTKKGYQNINYFESAVNAGETHTGFSDLESDTVEVKGEGAKPWAQS